MQSDVLLSKYPIITNQVSKNELKLILYELESLLQHGVHGSVVEFGCYKGSTSLFIRRLLDHYDRTINFHVYDSFQGLPKKTNFDLSPAGEQFKAGELSISKKEFIMQFKKAGLQLPYIHKGWFNELDPTDVPDNIFFAFLDGDYYESIKISLQLITQNLQENAVIVVDDYANEALPGASRAVDEWSNERQIKVSMNKSLGIIKIKHLL